MDANFQWLQQAEIPSGRPAAALFKAVQSVYITTFKQWLAITAPTSVIGALFFVLADQKIREIARTIPRWTESQHPGKIAEMMVLRFGVFFLLWLLGCFALGAVATDVSRLDQDEEDTALRDSHQRAREHFGALITIAVVTFLAFLIGMVLWQMVAGAIVKVVGWARFARFVVTVELIGYIVVASVVSWLGMAIPFVLRGGIGVRVSLVKSLEAADGYQGFLLLLVIQSVVGSYVGWYAAQYVLLLLVPASVYASIWYVWIALVVFALASAAVQPPMFIGLSLLAEESLCTTTTGEGQAMLASGAEARYS